MAGHTKVRKYTKTDIDNLKNDVGISAIYRADSPAEVETLFDGLTQAQKNTLLRSLAKLAWITMRELRDK